MPSAAAHHATGTHTAGSAQAVRDPCGHRGCTDQLKDRWWTLPNAVTGVRTLAAVALAGAAVSRHSMPLLLAALLSYWIGDMLDGLVARLTGQETRTGAVLDVLCDRVSVCLIVTVYVAGHPAALLPAAVFLLQFAVVDAQLTLAFARWSLLSPNYLHRVHRGVHTWNWSPVAKATNTALVVALWLTTGSIALTTAVAAAVLVVKAVSLARLGRVPVTRTLSGCATADAHPHQEP